MGGGGGQNRVRESWSRQPKCILYILIFFSVVDAAAAVVEPFARAGAGAAAATRKIIYINIRAVNCVLWHVK